MKLNNKDKIVITEDEFKRIKVFMDTEARNLEKFAFRLEFEKGTDVDLIEEIAKYQNEDGGFGNGIESDFMLPISSPMATTIGMKYLEKVDDNLKAQELIEQVIKYLENTLSKESGRWFSVPKQVNDYPHAPWWTYDEEKGMTAIDNSWGNPTVEIIGYLQKYKKYVKNLDVDAMIEDAVYRLNKKEKFNEEHELYCYIRMYNKMDDEIKLRMRDAIYSGIKDVINTDEAQWNGYVANPLKFIQEDSEGIMGIDQQDIDNNIDYLIREIKENRMVLPNWSWGDYQDQWETQRIKWCGVLTLETLIMLRKFDRLDVCE